MPGLVLFPPTFKCHLLNVYKKNNRENYLIKTEYLQSVHNLLAEAERAIRNGNRRDAYELSLRATQVEPKSVEAWILRASLAPSLEERVLCMNRLYELEPDYPDRHSVAFFTLKELLDRDPFLAYLEETEQLYRVFTTDRLVLNIPKRRSITTPYPQERPDKSKVAGRWLILAVLGLLTAGIGTLVFAPLAALSAFQAGKATPSESGQVHSIVILLASMLLFLIGLIFSYLFVIHLIG